MRGFEAVGLTLGLAFAAAYIAISWFRGKPTDLSSVVGTFLAVYASVTATEIIFAVMSVMFGGDVSDDALQLSPVLRVYIILGVITILHVSSELVRKIFRELFQKPAQTRADETASKKNGAKPPDSRE